MQVKIGNVLAGFLMIGSFYIFLQLRPQILGALQCIAKVGPGHPTGDQMTGCIAISLIVLGIVSSIRLIISERQK